MGTTDRQTSEHDDATRFDLGAPQHWIEGLMRVEGDGFGLRLDPAGRIADVSAGGEAVFGGLLGHTLWPLFFSPNEDAGPLQAEIETALRDGLVWAGTVRMPTAKGPDFSLSLFARAVRDPEKRLLGYWVMGQNNARTPPHRGKTPPPDQRPPADRA